jgi:hypothetical protein
MQTIKSAKFQANAQAMPAWEYEQMKRSERKQAKSLRAMKQGRKNMWKSGE